MTRKFIANLAFLLFLNLLVKPLGILLDIQVQNGVGAEDYGLYFAVFNFSYIFHLVLDMGISNFNNRSVAQSNEHLAEYLPSLLTMKLFLAIIYTVITLIGAVILGFTGMQLQLVGWLVVNQIMLSAILFFRSSISGMHLFRMDSILSVLDKVLLIIILAVLLSRSCYLYPFQIEWFVWAQTASLSTTALLAGIVVAFRSKALRFSFDLSKVSHLLKKAYPYALLGVLMSIYYRIDGVMIDRMLPDNDGQEAGIYAASYRLLEAANIVGLLFANLLLPMFARMLSKREAINKLVKFSATTLLSGSLLVTTIILAFGPAIVDMLYTYSDPYWAQVLQVLFLAYGAVSLVYVYGSLLTANASIRALNIIALGGAIMNIALNWILIPQYQALGAAIATLATQWVVAVAHILVSYRILNVGFQWKEMLRVAVFVAGLAGLYFFGSNAFSDVKINMALVSILGLLWAFVLRSIDLKGMLTMLRSREP